MKKNYLLLLSIITVFNSCTKEKCSPAETHTDYNDLKNEVLRNIKQPAISENLIYVTDFGAKGDSITKNKDAFDSAIKKGVELNGARIVVTPGVYILNGPIHLDDNICLDIQKDAKLIFSSNPTDYLPMVSTSWEGTLLYNYSPLIYAYEKKNIAIIGDGIIDGNGASGFSKWRPMQKESQLLSREMNNNSISLNERLFGENHFLRPQFIQLYKCENILLEDFLLKDSPFWCIHLLQSENITLRGIRFDAHNANNDGIDPEYSKNILIENITFNNADDNIAIKAGRDTEGRNINMASENIIIRNCHFKGLHAVVIGSEMSSGVKNVFVENCDAWGYCKRGIYLKSNPDRGGYIKNIYLKNLNFGEVEDLFYITSYYKNEGEGFVSSINDIYVDSLYCKNASNNGIVIQGFPTHKIHSVYFNNMKIESAKNPLSIKNAENIVFSEVEIGETPPSAPSSVNH